MPSVSVQVFGPAWMTAAIRTHVVQLSRRVPGDSGGNAVAVLMGGEWEKYLAAARAFGAASAAQWILVTGADSGRLGRAAKVGIQVFVCERDPLPDLEPALRAAARREAFCSPALAEGVVVALHEIARPDSEAWTRAGRVLSEPALAVVRLACRGLTNKQIAAHLCISANTAKYHLHNAFRLLEVKDRDELRRLLGEDESV